jgi:hypothetical protein
VKEHEDGPLAAPYGFVTPEDWSPAGFPLGVWLTHQRRSYKAGRLDPERVRELDGLGMVWAPREDAFADGIAAPGLGRGPLALSAAGHRGLERVPGREMGQDGKQHVVPRQALSLSFNVQRRTRLELDQRFRSSADV